MPILLVILISLLAVPFAIGCARIGSWLGDRPAAFRRWQIDRMRRAAKADLRRALNR